MNRFNFIPASCNFWSDKKYSVGALSGSALEVDPLTCKKLIGQPDLLTFDPIRAVRINLYVSLVL